MMRRLASAIAMLVVFAAPSRAADVFLSKYATIDAAFKAGLEWADPDRHGLAEVDRLELLQDLCDSQWTVHLRGFCRYSCVGQDTAPAEKPPARPRADLLFPPPRPEFCDKSLSRRVKAEKALDPSSSIGETTEQARHWIADQKAHGIISVHGIVVVRQSDMRWAGSIRYSCQPDLCQPTP